MGILESIIIAVSLCADCFAVSLCSSASFKSIILKEFLKTVLAFAVIQTGLLIAGWLFGDLLYSLISTISHVASFLLLLYVGGSMIWEGIKSDGQGRNIKGWLNIILAGIATSIDALAVGASQSLSKVHSMKELFPLICSLFICTLISAGAGIICGRNLGYKFGRKMEIIGGAVLVCIGLTILFSR